MEQFVAPLRLGPPLQAAVHDSSYNVLQGMY